MLSPEEIARIFDVPVDAILEGAKEEYGIPRLLKALHWVRIQKAHEEWFVQFQANVRTHWPGVPAEVRLSYLSDREPL